MSRNPTASSIVGCCPLRPMISFGVPTSEPSPEEPLSPMMSSCRANSAR
ncbi:MAG: hypothetical protein HOV94_35665 [Saccharothrix sp.]|nr:hypothetical protein [Saccharothrix sp.]